MDFRDRQVVVTGGTGALGTAVVGALIDAGATCHVPNFDTRELAGFAHAGKPGVSLTTGVDLTDQDEVDSYYAALPGFGRRSTSPGASRWRPSPRPERASSTTR